MPSRAPSDPETAMMLGEMRGQLREMIHNMNNEAQKGVARDEKLTKLAAIPDDISDIKNSVKSIEGRLSNLETDKVKRETERGVLATVVRSPLVGWIAGFALAVWAWWKGQGNA